MEPVVAKSKMFRTYSILNNCHSNTFPFNIKPVTKGVMNEIKFNQKNSSNKKTKPSNSIQKNLSESNFRKLNTWEMIRDLEATKTKIGMCESKSTLSDGLHNNNLVLSQINNKTWYSNIVSESTQISTKIEVDMQKQPIRHACKFRRNPCGSPPEKPKKSKKKSRKFPSFSIPSKVNKAIKKKMEFKKKEKIEPYFSKTKPKKPTCLEAIPEDEPECIACPRSVNKSFPSFAAPSAMNKIIIFVANNKGPHVLPKRPECKSEKRITKKKIDFGLTTCSGQKKKKDCMEKKPPCPPKIMCPKEKPNTCISNAELCKAPGFKLNPCGRPKKIKPTSEECTSNKKPSNEDLGKNYVCLMRERNSLNLLNPNNYVPPSSCKQGYTLLEEKKDFMTDLYHIFRMAEAPQIAHCFKGYKNKEYHLFTDASFYDLNRYLMKHRGLQPSAKRILPPKLPEKVAKKTKK